VQRADQSYGFGQPGFARPLPFDFRWRADMLDLLDSIGAGSESSIVPDSVAREQNDIARLGQCVQRLKRNQVDATPVRYHKFQTIQAMEPFAGLFGLLSGFERLIVRGSHGWQDHNRA